MSDLPSYEQVILGEGAFGRVVQIPELGPSGEKLVHKIICLTTLLKEQPSFSLSTCIREIKVLESLEKQVNLVGYYESHFLGPNASAYAEEGEGKISNRGATDDNLDYLYIKMEACDLNLAQFLSSFPTQNARDNNVRQMLYNYLEQIATGLAYIHYKGIIHRDFTPKNILLKGDIIKIGDFGLSHLLLEADESKQSKTIGVGTKCYRAPELIAGNKYENSVDIFSFGLVLLEVLHAFTEDSKKQEVFQDIQKKRYWTKPLQDCVKSIRVREALLFVLMTRSEAKLRPTAENIRTWLKTSNILISKAKKNFCSTINLNYTTLEKFWVVPPEDSRIEFDIPMPIKTFRGRRGHLNNLKLLLTQENVGFVVLHGLTGIGKTSLALQFLQEEGGLINNGNTGRFHMARLQFDTEISLLSSILQLSENSGLDVPSNDESGKLKDALTVFREILSVIQKRWNMEDRRWLLILDNFDECHSLGLSVTHELQKSIMGDSSPPFFTLVTTQKRDILDQVVSSPLIRKIEVEKWDESDAVEFVQEVLAVDNDKAGLIKLLCARLENSPMALTQAVAYINEELNRRTEDEGSSFGIGDYLELLQTMDNDSSLYLTVAGEQRTLSHTLSLSYNRLQSNEEKSILQILSYFNPNSIPYDFLTRLLVPKIYPGSSFTEAIVKNTLTTLKAYSLIRIESRVVYIHRLVQKFGRSRDTTNSQTVLKDATLWTTRLSCSCELFKSEDLTQCLALWEHLKKNIDRSSILKAYKMFPRFVASRLFEKGRLLQLVPFSEEALNIMRDEVGCADIDTLSLHRFYGEGLREFGLWDEALEVLQDALDCLKGKEEEEEYLFLALSNTVGLVYDRAGKLYQAGDTYKNILTVLSKKYGDKGSEGACITMNNLAGILVRMDKEQGNESKEWTKQALLMYKNVLEWQRANLPGKDRHPMTLATMNNLSLCQSYLGQHENAKKNLEKVLPFVVSSQGEGHPDTLTCRDAYSKVLWELGHRTEARAELQKVLEGRRALHPPTHPMILDILENLRQWDEVLGFVGRN